MERRAGSDVIFLMDEKFDFDFSLSPDSSEGEDDVFADPCRHLAPDNFESEVAGGAQTTWAPLSGDQLDAVCQEATRLAERLQGENEAAASPEDGERFIRDGAAKLDALAAPSGLCGPVKRQTFLVQDSPMTELPPAVRQRLRRGTAGVPGARVAPATRLSASSPADAVKTRAALRGRAGLGALLPSKPALPRTNFSVAHKTRVQPPGKLLSDCKPSPYLAKSCEDIPSDLASDVGDSSLNSGTLGRKRTLAPPTKVVRSGMKVTPIQSRKPTERRKTSSSSSSVSSFNSSLSLSPGKLNSSQSRSLSSSNCAVVPGQVSRPANQNKRRSGVMTAAHSSSSAAGRCNGTLPGQCRKLSDTAARTTPQRQTTPAKRTLDKTSAARIQNGPTAKNKPAALGQTATPCGPGFYSPAVSKVLKPKTRMSVASMDSLPQKAPSGPLTPSAGVSKSLQLRSQRPSGLPTPLKRRASATPGSHGRPARMQAASDSDCLPRTCLSPAPAKVEPVEVQPFCLEEEPPAEPGQSEKPEPSGHGQSEPESAKQEVLLMDLPAPATHDKLLIDLSNTPDLIRKSTKNCADVQLIDLSSPLIKWSPEDKTENSTPLINLSF